MRELVGDLVVREHTHGDGKPPETMSRGGWRAMQLSRHVVCSLDRVVSLPNSQWISSGRFQVNTIYPKSTIGEKSLPWDR